MAFSNTKLNDVLEKYNLIEDKQDIFPNLQAVLPSEWLIDMIAMANELPLNSEKAKSEFIVSPILLEVWKKNNKQFSIFSGVTLDVQADLKGECDFILSKAPKSKEIQAPIFTLIEAKDDNIRNGWGQCVMQMYAAQKFNEMKKRDIPVIYGCITTGDDWQFLKLEGNIVTFDDKRFYLSEVGKILSIFNIIVKDIA
jgi:hypothetical protein